MKNAAQQKRAKDELTEFHERYDAVLEAVARYVHGRVQRGQVYVTTDQVARWIAHDLPDLYRRTFDKAPKALKAWRVKTMLSNAAYLGAYGSLDIRTVRGKGFTTALLRKGRRLQVIRGGKEG